MDTTSPFAQEYAAQTGVSPQVQQPNVTTIPDTTTSSPFVTEYANQTGTTPQVQPSDVSSATQLQTNPNSQKYNGYCQQLVDDILNTPNENRAPSATAAWQNYQTNGKAVQGIIGIQPGDLIYFQDPNDPNGHVGIYSGKDKFISATQEDPSQPIQTHSLKAWKDLTGDSIVGYVRNPQALPQIGGQDGQ